MRVFLHVQAPQAETGIPVKLRPLTCALLITCSLVPINARAQVSEKEMQSIEAQEFGIQNSKKKKVQNADAPPTSAPQNQAPPEDYQRSSEAERVKSIEAEEFRVRAIRKSKSGRIVMFEDATDNRPRPGRILLIKRDNQDIVAVRVLKNYAGKFAAKVILPVGETEIGVEYRAIKKLGDKIIALIREREKRGKDLDTIKTDEELAKEVSPDDNELDRGIPPPKKRSTKKVVAKPEGDLGPSAPAAPHHAGGPAPLFTPDGREIGGPESIEIKDEDEPMADLSVQEELPLEPHRHALSLEYGSMKNVDRENNPASYGGIGLRYAFNVWRMPMWRRRTLQDMLSLEAGFFYYTINGFEKNDDSVTVIPLLVNLRYTLLFGETFSIFGYLGVIKNNVSQGDASTSTVSSKTTLLARTHSALGAGAMLKIGPAWAVRVEVGNDLFGIGAVVKF